MDHKGHIVKVETMETSRGTKYFASCSVCKMSTGGEPDEGRATAVLNAKTCDQGVRLAK